MGNLLFFTRPKACDNLLDLSILESVFDFSKEVSLFSGDWEGLWSSLFFPPV
ncbi:MAG: hypothetical protein Rsou_1567 [Candidatus Ruthia sp. Asou_11_S2]|nr:hypothetical protein [Candidatus Ruthia sp. Asou_11_S2]